MATHYNEIKYLQIHESVDKPMPKTSITPIWSDIVHKIKTIKMITYYRLWYERVGHTVLRTMWDPDGIIFIEIYQYDRCIFNAIPTK